MKKMRFSLSKIMCGITLLMSGAAIGQYNVIPIGPIIIPPAAVTTGYTHATTILDDCTSGNANIEANFAMNLATFGGNGTYRVAIKLYKGDWTISGMGMTVTNEAYVTTIYSTGKVFPAIFIPIGGTYPMTTATFFSTPPSPSIIVNKNGTYRMTTTLQRKINVVTWSDIYTTPLSSVYLTLDLPPYTTYGDLAEVAHVENLNIAANFDFKINGQVQGTVIPQVITCSAVPLKVTNTVNWFGNPGMATVTVEKGNINSNIFTPFGTPSTITFSSDGQDKDLSTLYPSNYSGPLRITYQLPDDYCYGVLTPVIKTMTVSVATAAFISNFQAPTGSAVIPGNVCPSSAQTKALSPTWNITTTMPSNASASLFKCELKTAIGWQAAKSAGLADLTYAGAYSIDVYEVNPSTGGRLLNAPSLFLKSGTTASNDQVNFNDYGFCVEFDRFNPPFYTSTLPSLAAEPSGNVNGGSDYFKQYYAHVYGNLIPPVTFTSFSAKVFCAEVNLYLTGGCSESKKSYFRIANNGLASGGNVRLASSNLEESEQQEYMALEVYPNPTKGELNIPVSDDETTVSIIIIDNLGKQVLSISDVKTKGGKINIENLTAGIYFYTINKDNSLYRGKIVKQ